MKSEIKNSMIGAVIVLAIVGVVYYLYSIRESHGTPPLVKNGATAIEGIKQ